MIFILFITLVFLLIINIKLNDKDFISPSVIFNFVFTFSSFICCLYYKKWNMELHVNTYLVIVIGVIIFFLTCYIIRKKFFNKIEINHEIKKINIDKNLQIIFLIFGIVTIIFTVRYVLNSVNSDILHLRTALYSYRDKIEFRNADIGLPFILNICTGIMHAAGFWLIYCFINNIMIEKNFNKILLINIILCLISTLLEGSRAMAVNYVLFTFCSYMFCLNYKNNFKFKIERKTLIIFSIIAVILLLSFRFSAILIGRDNVSTMSTSDYIALYTGSEIKNLDTFLQEEHSNIQLGKYTFSSLFKTVGKIFKINTSLNSPFRSVNGYNLGNVYTIFYQFFMDFHYFGIIIMTILMATISQLIYEKSKRLDYNSRPKLLILIYCYIFGGIFYSFFSNQFFTLIFSLGFIKYLIIWYIMNCIFISPMQLGRRIK